MPTRPRLSHFKDITQLVSDVFDLSETSAQIIRALSATRKALSVNEIKKRLKRSERSIRGALVKLVNKGLLKRKVRVTDSKRLSYIYFLGPLERVVKVTRREILNQLEKLEKLEGNYLQRLRKARRPTRD